MNALLQKFHDELTRLQNAEDHIKKRWLIGLSACAMVFIVSLWILYMNFAVGAIEPIQEGDAQVSQENSGGAMAGLKEWTGMAMDELRASASHIFSKLAAPNQLELKKEWFNFIPDKNLPSR